MPGKWQVRILAALAHESPLGLGALRGRCQAHTLNERIALAHALRTLVAQGRVRRRAKGRYALAPAGAARRRARVPHTKAVVGG